MAAAGRLCYSKSPRSETAWNRCISSGRSAAWLARLVRDQEVEGSNPFAPTTFFPQNHDDKSLWQRVSADLPETVLRFDPETHRLSLGGTRFEADRRQCEAAILDFLRDTREAQTQVQVREGVQGKTIAIRAALTELVRSSDRRRNKGQTLPVRI